VSTRSDPQPSEEGTRAPADPAQVRADLLAAGARGRDFCVQYAAGADAWVRDLFAHAALPDRGRVALLAVGGYGRSELCPASDFDLVLVHDGVRDVSALAESLWYPVWDSGVHLDYSVRTPKELRALTASDVKVALGLLDGRPIAGDRKLSERVLAQAGADWSERPQRSLERLHEVVIERWARAGDVAFLAEPDLKRSRGGLRDIEALAAATRAAPEIVMAGNGRFAAAHETVLAARVALHAVTGRATDVLLRQDQEEVATRLGHADLDALMAELAAAGRRIAWVGDDFWQRARAWARTGSGRRGAPRREVVEPGIVVRDGEVVVEEHEPVVGAPSLALRVAAAAARRGYPMAPTTVSRLEREAPAPGEPWPVSTRDALVRLLACGPAAIPMIETLDHVDVFRRYFPEWDGVRSRRQKVPYHRFTVDRHLLETAAGAATLVRTVRRPDLLLVGALLHDIGKGQPGDHTEAGTRMVEAIGARMGFSRRDRASLVRLVRDHLLLAETATRRDLDDPRTIAAVAEAVGTTDDLELLAALTEADSIATGPSAWSPWKANLVALLVERVRAELGGLTWEPSSALPTADHRRLMAAGGLRLAANGEELSVVAPDKPGVLAAVTGALAVHRLPVRSAMVASEDGMAVEQFELDTSLVGGAPDWRRVEHDIGRALDDPSFMAKKVGAGANPAPPGQRPPPVVIFDNDASERATVAEVRAADGRGVLFRIVRAISDTGFDIVSAKVATIGDEVIDSFYLRDAVVGTKVVDGEKLHRLEGAILAGLEAS